MPEIKLADEEMAVLRMALASLRVKKRTNELGIMHAGRFVSVQDPQPLVLKTKEKELLDRIAQKMGLNGLSPFEG